MTLPEPSRRAILLGASNLERGLSIAVATAQACWGGPLDCLVASGHGRSYGQASSVLGRTLPGIVECGLWDDLAARPLLPTAALLTDIGNDIVYGIGVRQIAAWVEWCLQQLAPRCERLVVTALPLDSLAALSPWRYRVLRAILFPCSRVSFDEAVARAHELNARVLELAAAHRATIVVPRAAWYGFDLIHIRRGCWSSAWRELLASWCADSAPRVARGAWRRWLSLKSACPQRRRMWGFELRRAQPARSLRDGTRVSLY